MVKFKHPKLKFVLIISLCFLVGIEIVRDTNTNENWLFSQSTLINKNQVIPAPQPSAMNNNTYWLTLANNAWRYFEPGNSVNSVTGLHSADLYSADQDAAAFTDWDLGVYIQAIIDAEKIGIINSTGPWGSDARFDKILTFLETRPLSPDRQPYLWYVAKTGQNREEEPQVATDTGNLLVSLKYLENHKPNLKTRIDNIVYTRTNYEPQKHAVEVLSNSVNIYDYYVTLAFAQFWPEKFSSQANSMLDNISNAPTVQTYGVTLPKAKLSLEPIILSIFYLNPDARLLKIANQMFLAHEARYNATGKYTAFTEGNTEDFSGGTYIWEWVVLPDGRTWVIKRDETTDTNISPIIYVKAAVALLAIYNTQFTKDMVSAIEPISFTNRGYMNGINENKQVITAIIDKTNAMIIGAAKYAIENGVQSPASSHSPIQSPIPSLNSNFSGNPTVGNPSTSGPISTPLWTNSAAPNPINSNSSSSDFATSLPSASLTSSNSSESPPLTSTPSKQSSLSPESQQNAIAPIEYLFVIVIVIVIIVISAILIRKKKYSNQTID